MVTLIDQNMGKPPDMKTEFQKTMLDFDDVFCSTLDGYNGKAGRFEAKVNLRPVQPPQRKGRIPQYSCNQLEELLRQFSELESKGVLNVLKS